MILNDINNIICYQIILNDTLNIKKKTKDTLIAENRFFLRRKIFYFIPNDTNNIY